MLQYMCVSVVTYIGTTSHLAVSVYLFDTEVSLSKTLYLTSSLTYS
jgi:hypothetical protein